jgi:fructoselysine 6-kinase
MREIRICAVGDNVVDLYPATGTMYPGGNAVNVAVHARRCGANSSYVGVVGTDAAGQLVKAALAAEEVELERLRVANGPNAYATVYVDDNGNRSFGECAKNVSLFRLNEDDLQYLRSFDIVHSGECSVLEDQLSRIASACTVSFDFAERPESYVLPLLPLVKIATFSRAGIATSEAERLLLWAQRHGPDTVVVTRGAAGSSVAKGDEIWHIDAEQATVVDTLGAGDAYIAQFLTALVAGESGEASGKAASGYAARVCGEFGAFGFATEMSRRISSEVTHGED